MTKYPEVEQHLRLNRYRWCVTGAAGFIGSHLAERLVLLGQDVVAVDNLSTGKRDNLPAGVEFIEGDVTSISQERFRGVDFVLHQAALGSVPRSIEEPLASHHANVTGFINVLVQAVSAGVRKVVFASSSSVYGDSPELPKVESRVGALLSPYAATKMIDEVYAAVFSRCYQLPLIGLRYFNVFGPRQDPNGAYAAVIPAWINALLRGEPCFINGDGTNSRDFCFVENVIQANLLAALSKRGFGVYNIACGATLTLNDLYAKLASLCEVSRGPVYRENRKGDIAHSFADISLAEAELGYQPVIQVDEGLKITVDFFRSLR
jgi:UDP-N-acetylglucosamine 4-epimerase